jgi:hypothetical protein
MVKEVIFSERAYVAMMAETIEHIKTETGGVFLGRCVDNTWYVIESVDPGPQSVFGTGHFEYDTPYINWLINKLNKIYNEPLRLIGLWHRHPGSMDTFSSTDDGTNAKYAELNPEGAISALVNIDPYFRVTVYAVAQPCRYSRIVHTVKTAGIPAALRAYASIDSLKETFSRAGSAGGKAVSLKDVLQEAFINPIDTRLEALSIGNDDIEPILEVFEEDIDYLSGLGISCNLEMANTGILRLYDAKVTRSWNQRKPVGFEITANKQGVYVKYGGKIFEYLSGMIKKAHKREVV